MSKDEMRFCRREVINFCLHQIYHSKKPVAIKKFVRSYEQDNYGYELKAYAMAPKLEWFELYMSMTDEEFSDICEDYDWLLPSARSALDAILALADD